MLKLLPIVMLVLGAGAGVGAGLFLQPKAEVDEPHAPAQDHAETTHEDPHHAPSSAQAASHNDADTHSSQDPTLDYVKMNNQFVVPVVTSERIESLVVLSLSIEAEPALREAIYAREPKIRDAFLRVLFDHASIGGFQGIFTRSKNLDILRTMLTEAAQHEFGHGVRSVLIVDIARQDV